MGACWARAAAATTASTSHRPGPGWYRGCWTRKGCQAGNTGTTPSFGGDLSPRSVSPYSLPDTTPSATIRAPRCDPSEARYMFRTAMTVGGFDPELDAAINGERQRQEDHIELIASENYVSPRVLEAQGSVLTNKYAEGYPGERYYGGCEFVDVAEELAISRAKQIFGAAHAN